MASFSCGTKGIEMSRAGMTNFVGTSIGSLIPARLTMFKRGKRQTWMRWLHIMKIRTGRKRRTSRRSGSRGACHKHVFHDSFAWLRILIVYTIKWYARSDYCRNFHRSPLSYSEVVAIVLLSKNFYHHCYCIPLSGLF